MRCKWVLWIGMGLLGVTAVYPQRRGAVEMGGSFSFQSGSSLEKDSNSELNLSWLVGSYLSRNLAVELEPQLDIAFSGDSTIVGGLFLAGLAARLVDLSPEIPTNAQFRKYELGTSASVFATIGTGLWVSGVALPTKPGVNYSGPVVFAGLSTHTYLGNMTSLRVNVKYAHLFPSGPVYNHARGLWQIGIGFTIFVRS